MIKFKWLKCQSLFWLPIEANAQPPVQTISPALGEVATPGHQNISIEMRKLTVKSYVCCRLLYDVVMDSCNL